MLKINTMLQSKVITKIFAIPKKTDNRSVKEELLTIKTKLNINLT